MPLLHFLSLFALGACVGSFLNVVIYRLPLRKSLLTPPSFCPRCGQALRARDNLPLIGWLWLRGRGRCCGAPISARYPAVELLTALLWGVTAVVVAAPRYGVATDAGLLTAHLVFIAALIAVVFIDADWQIIPDALSLGGLGAALAASAALPVLHAEALAEYPAVNARLVAFLAAFFGAAVGAAAAYGVSLLGTFLYRRQLREIRRDHPEIDSVLGLGDVKLMAFFGAFFGAAGALTIFVLGTFYGALFGLIQRWRGGVVIPFGPFLAAGALTWLFFAAPLRDFISVLF
ncbi:MAG: prepilin peptidase [Planctomycetota bacterium]|jgi:leader peptidase (prepilin peptidase)/N-methyltransferase|nr:prepilin peptidase [Planctomycetota bacterium]